MAVSDSRNQACLALSMKQFFDPPMIYQAQTLFS